MNVMADKIYGFLFHLNQRGEQKIRNLFEYVTVEEKTGYNKKLEHFIGLLIVIGKAVIQEFGDYPEKIGINPLDHIAHYNDYVENEDDVVIQNFGFLKEVFEMFKNCHSAYKIIQTTYDREAEDTGRMRVILDALDKTRYLCGELQEKFKVFERNYFVSVNF